MQEVGATPRGDGRLRARGGSMFPAIPSGSMLTLRPYVGGPLRAGVVVGYLGRDGELIAHRVVGLAGPGGTRRLWVRGDAQPVAEPLDPARLAYVVEAVALPGIARRLGYRTDGPVGRALASAAIADGPALRAMSIGARLALGALRRLRGR